MTEREEVVNFMLNIKNRTPILLIGKAAEIFKTIYSGRIYSLKNEDDLQDITDMTASKLTKAVVIEDLSQIYNDEDFLKLVEESSLQLILLASKDNLSEILMSRCKSILKIPNLEVTSCSYIKENLALNNMNNFKDSNELEFYLCNNCPQLVYDKNRVKQFKYKDKLINIIANLNSREEE